MQTRDLILAGRQSALALLLVLSGGAVAAQGMPAGTPGDSGAETTDASKFADRKVSIDAESKRLVEVIPQLLKSVGAEFIIDADVKNAVVSSHLTSIKLQTALDVLMRVSDIPVQVKFEKGVYHFSKKVELPPETPHAPPTPLLPGESVLPPPPTEIQGDIDIHNVQTFDLLRVLNGLFNVPVEIVPDPNGGPSHGAASGYGNTNASYSGFANSSSLGLNGHGFTVGGGNSVLGEPGNGNGVQHRNGSGTITVFGHPVHFGG